MERQRLNCWKGDVHLLRDIQRDDARALRVKLSQGAFRVDQILELATVAAETALYPAPDDPANISRWTPLALAASCGSVNVMKLLLEDFNADPNFCGDPHTHPLIIAIYPEETTFYDSENKDLLEYEDRSVLVGKETCALMLLRAGADPRVRWAGIPALFFAVKVRPSATTCDHPRALCG